MYVLLCRPFKDPYDNLLNAFNELVLLIIYTLTLLVNMLPILTQYAGIFGWVMIVLVLASLAATWILMIPGAIKEFINTVREFCRGESSENSGNESKGPEAGKTKIYPLRAKSSRRTLSIGNYTGNPIVTIINVQPKDDEMIPKKEELKVKS